MEWTYLQTLIGAAGGGARLFREYYGEGVQVRIPPLDLIQVRVD